MTAERRTSDRRLSPAVGEFAILECARLREQSSQWEAKALEVGEENARLREELLQCRSTLALAAGDGELIAELLILVKASFSFSKYSAAIHFTEPRKPTKEWLVGHAELIEDLQPKLEAAIAKAEQ